MKHIVMDRPEYIVNILKGVGKDGLSQFVSHGYRDELVEVQTANFKLFLDACTHVGLTYVFLGASEISGCEGILSPKPWPAIWRVAKMLGCPGSCGNSDQYQVSKAAIYFGKERIGAWHVLERRPLTPEEEVTKRFCKVVAGRKGFEVPLY
jgi:hypothetical protein